jgi:hypothetical protein
MHLKTVVLSIILEFLRKGAFWGNTEVHFYFPDLVLGQELSPSS